MRYINLFNVIIIKATYKDKMQFIYSKKSKAINFYYFYDFSIYENINI